MATNWPAGTSKSMPFKISTLCAPFVMVRVKPATEMMG